MDRVKTGQVEHITTEYYIVERRKGKIENNLMGSNRKSNRTEERGLE